MRLQSTVAVLAGLMSGAIAQVADPAAAAAAAAASSASAAAASASSSNAAVAAAASSKNAAAAAAAAGGATAATTAAAAGATAAATAAAGAGTTTGEAAGDSQLVGTWSTKSKMTLTGPGFYDPVSDTLIEPNRTGISYSFTSDGYYEEAYYRAIANPTSPDCPSAIMQWQHGTYVHSANGSLELTPFAVDGRQLLSDPCTAQTSTYTRYNQSEIFERYSIYTDPYHGILRLDMYQFDGTPLQPMFLVYSPPNMLPTITLNPTEAVPGATQTSNAKARKAKRGLEREVPVNYKGANNILKQSSKLNPDTWWWAGLTMTGVGGLLYFGPRRMGM
ncbi:hypothetical protein AAFC00_002507 [Neodothiora populina]|uniref:Protein ROT1 n=1 Tax=Neodothiora populina TaxID=2781224 RepID=A0ABR3P8N1_9PEZI